MGQNSSKWFFGIPCAAPLFPSLCEGSIEMTLACCPHGWISLPHWPPCRSLKGQSRKTPALIRYDGSACHPGSIWKTETSWRAERSYSCSPKIHSSSCHQARWLDGYDALSLPYKSALQLALLTFVSIIPLVSPKWLDDWSLRAILVCISGCKAGQWKQCNTTAG